MPKLDGHVNDFTEMLETLGASFGSEQFIEEQINILADSESPVMDCVL